MESKEGVTLKSSRLYELDGLRGVAALWVATHHFWGAIQKREVDWVPTWVGSFFDVGFFGVDIFFVLSGFVIMHSVSDAKVDGGFVPKFMLRRSIRLDPPYWCAIIVAVALMLLKGYFFSSQVVNVPDLSTFIAHLFYLQDILGLQPISAVFWTLCLEFQFYLIFSFAYFLYVKMDVFRRGIYIDLIVVLAFFLCFISPVLRFSGIDFYVSGTIIPFAYEFVLGVLAYFCINRYLSFWIIFLAIMCLAISTIAYRPIYYVFIPVSVVFFLYFSRKSSALSWMRSKALLFLGRISYSFYLTHASIGWVSISLMVYLASGNDSDIVTGGIFIFGILVSLVFATVFYSLVEAPSLNLSKIFKNKLIAKSKSLEIS